MGHAGGELPNHRQLARLHQLVLCSPESGFCADALLHFLLQAFVGLLQVGRALLHLALQLIVRGLQRFACGQAVTHAIALVAPPLVEHETKQRQEGRARAGNQGVTLGRLVGPRHVREHGERPRCARQGTRLGQEPASDRVHRCHLGALARHTHHARALVQIAQHLDAQGREGTAVVLQGLVKRLARVLVQRAQGREFPVGHRAQNHHAVLVGHDDRGLNGGPRLLQLVQADLGDRHTHGAVAVEQRRCQVVAGLSARGADAKQAPGATAECIAKVGAELQVLAHEAVRPPPVAGGHHPAIQVDDVDRQRACALIQLLEIGADFLGLRGGGIGRKQGQHLFFQIQRARKKGVFADLTLQAGGVQLQPVQPRGLDLRLPHTQSHHIGQPAAEQHPAQQQQNHQVTQGSAQRHVRSQVGDGSSAMKDGHPSRSASGMGRRVTAG